MSSFTYQQFGSWEPPFGSLVSTKDKDQSLRNQLAHCRDTHGSMLCGYTPKGSLISPRQFHSLLLEPCYPERNAPLCSCNFLRGHNSAEWNNKWNEMSVSLTSKHFWNVFNVALKWFCLMLMCMIKYSCFSFELVPHFLFHLIFCKLHTKSLFLDRLAVYHHIWHLNSYFGFGLHFCYSLFREGREILSVHR